jgi:hypothetical protein
MNSQEHQNWQRKLEELEAEINPTPIAEEKQDQAYPYQDKMTKIFTIIVQWFNQLPSLGKIIVTVVGAMITLSLLSTVFKLVTALVSLCILGILLYITYKLLIVSRS